MFGSVLKFLNSARSISGMAAVSNSYMEISVFGFMYSMNCINIQNLAIQHEDTVVSVSKIWL